jgi:hypothetical protein
MLRRKKSGRPGRIKREGSISVDAMEDLGTSPILHCIRISRPNTRELLLLGPSEEKAENPRREEDPKWYL